MITVKAGKKKKCPKSHSEGFYSIKAEEFGFFFLLPIFLSSKTVLNFTAAEH